MFSTGRAGGPEAGGQLQQSVRVRSPELANWDVGGPQGLVSGLCRRAEAAGGVPLGDGARGVERGKGRHRAHLLAPPAQGLEVVLHLRCDLQGRATVRQGMVTVRVTTRVTTRVAVVTVRQA